MQYRMKTIREALQIKARFGVVSSIFSLTGIRASVTFLRGKLSVLHMCSEVQVRELETSLPSKLNAA